MLYCIHGCLQMKVEQGRSRDWWRRRSCKEAYEKLKLEMEAESKEKLKRFGEAGDGPLYEEAKFMIKKLQKATSEVR